MGNINKPGNTPEMGFTGTRRALSNLQTELRQKKEGGNIDLGGNFETVPNSIREIQDTFGRILENNFGKVVRKIKPSSDGQSMVYTMLYTKTYREFGHADTVEPQMLQFKVKGNDAQVALGKYQVANGKYSFAGETAWTPFSLGAPKAELDKVVAKLRGYVLGW